MLLQKTHFSGHLIQGIGQYQLQVNPHITNRLVQRKTFVIEELLYKQTEEKSFETLNYQRFSKLRQIEV